MRSPMFVVAVILSAATCAPPARTDETAFLVTHLSLGSEGDAMAGIDLDDIDTALAGSTTCSDETEDKWSLMVPGEHGVDNWPGLLALISYAIPEQPVRPSLRA